MPLPILSKISILTALVLTTLPFTLLHPSSRRRCLTPFVGVAVLAQFRQIFAPGQAFHSFSKMFGVRGSTAIVSDIVLRLRQTLSLHGVRAQCINIGGGVGGEIPDNKRLQYALQHIHGIGRAKAHHIVCELGVENKYVKDLSKRELYSLRELLSKYMLGNELRKVVEKDVERLVSIQCYRGFRHMDGLPCRGQRTHTNARTRKSRPGVGARWANR